MDWVKFNYNMSNINNLLGSTNSALEGAAQKQKASDILIDFGKNIMSGALRNEIAYDMKRATGSDLGIAINDVAGYGTKEANQKGMQGLMGASVFNGMLGGGCCGGYMGGYPMMGMGGCMGGYPMMGGMTYTSPGLLGGMFNGTMMPTMPVTPYFNQGMSTFQNNGFFA